MRELPRDGGDTGRIVHDGIAASTSGLRWATVDQFAGFVRETGYDTMQFNS
jgi:hypothetical protein